MSDVEDFSTYAEDELRELAKSCEEVAQKAHARAGRITRELRRRFTVTLAPGDWAQEQYGLAHAVRRIETEDGALEVVSMCGRRGRSFRPTERERQRPPGALATRRCQKCVQSVEKARG